MRAIRFLGGIVLGLIIGFAATGYAGDVRTGEVIKVEKDSVTIEDFDTGQQVKIRRDDKTRIKGKLEVGALVELEEKKGQAISINVVAEEEEKDIEEEPAQESEKE